MAEHDDPPADGNGQSDRTVMLRVDQTEAEAPRPEASDATVLGLEFPPEPPESATSPSIPVASVTERSVNLPVEPSTQGVMPVAPPAGSPPPRRATGQIPAQDAQVPTGRRMTGQMAAVPREPPRRATGQIPAQSAPAPKRPTGQIPAQPAPAPTPKRPTGQIPAQPAPAPKRTSTGQLPATRPPQSSPGPRRATGTMPVARADAPSAPVPSDTVLFEASTGPNTAPVALSNETVMFDTGARAPLAAGEEPTSAIVERPKPPRAGLASTDADTAAGKLAGDDRPTATRRPLANLVGDEAFPEPADAPGTQTIQGIGAGRSRGLPLIIGAFGLLIAGALGAKLAFGQPKPSTTELRLLYPYGTGGTRLPSGRTAPGADEMDFTYVKVADCAGHECLEYKASRQGGGFAIEMFLRNDDGDWVLATTSQP